MSSTPAPSPRLGITPHAIVDRLEAKTAIYLAVAALVFLYLLPCVACTVVVLDNKRISAERRSEQLRSVEKFDALRDEMALAVAASRYQGETMGRLEAIRDRLEKSERNIETLNVYHSLEPAPVDDKEKRK